MENYSLSWQVTDNRWVLAESLIWGSEAPKEAMESLFSGIIQGLEEIAQIEFDPLIKERVWSVVSKNRLETLQDTLVLECSEKILGGFQENEIVEMLENHKATGRIGPAHSPEITFAYNLYKDDIITAVMMRADSMKHDLVFDVVEAIEKEGILVPEC